jgi:transposase-like protein
MRRYTAEFKAQLIRQIPTEEKSVDQLAAEQGTHPNSVSLEISLSKRYPFFSPTKLPKSRQKGKRLTQNRYITRTLKQVNSLLSLSGSNQLCSLYPQETPGYLQF